MISGTLLDKPRFRKIDDQNRGDHSNLTPNDECYFLYEYTSGQNYSFSDTNSLISNLKKKPSLSRTPAYRYKERAIARCASDLQPAFNAEWLKVATLVPVPPSKSKDDPEYDDRLARICRAIQKQPSLDVREIVYQRSSLVAAHETQGNRPSVEDLLAVYAIDEQLTPPAPKTIGVVDDVLTVGTHFVAMRTILGNRFPNIKIYGFFIARRVFSNPFEEFVFE
jgi:predicted amidophosphoribosyltransferase